MIDNGEQTEFEAVRGHLFMLVAMPFMEEFDQLMVKMTGYDNGDVEVSLDCDNEKSVYVLYRQQGEDAWRKCEACMEYLQAATKSA